MRGGQGHHLAAIDRDPRGTQLRQLAGCQTTATSGQQHHIVAPPTHQNRHVHRSLIVGQHCQRLIADLPATAERTVEHRTSPQLSQSGHRRQPILHAHGQQHSFRPLAGTVSKLDFESSVPTLGGQHLAAANFDARIPFQLFPAQLIELCGRTTVVPACRWRRCQAALPCTQVITDRRSGSPDAPTPHRRDRTRRSTAKPGRGAAGTGWPDRRPARAAEAS